MIGTNPGESLFFYNLLSSYNFSEDKTYYDKFIELSNMTENEITNYLDINNIDIIDWLTIIDISSYPIFKEIDNKLIISCFGD